MEVEGRERPFLRTSLQMRDMFVWPSQPQGCCFGWIEAALPMHSLPWSGRAGRQVEGQPLCDVCHWLPPGYVHRWWIAAWPRVPCLQVGLWLARMRKLQVRRFHHFLCQRYRTCLIFPGSTHLEERNEREMRICLYTDNDLPVFPVLAAFCVLLLSDVPFENGYRIWQIKILQKISR